MKKNNKALEKVLGCFYFFKEVFFSLQNVMESVLAVGFENLKDLNFSSPESFENCYLYLKFLNQMDLPDIQKF